MTSPVKIDVRTGINAQLTFTQLRKKMSDAIRKGVDKSAAGLKVARQHARKRTRILDRSLGKKAKTYPDGTIIGIVGPRAGFNSVLTSLADGKLIGTQGSGKRQKALVVTAFRKSQPSKVIRIDPRYYAHLAGPRRRGAEQFMIPAAEAMKAAAPAAIAEAIKGVTL